MPSLPIRQRTPDVPVASRLFADDVDVLRELGLSAGPGPRPCFGDDLWDFGAVEGIPNAQSFPNNLATDWMRIANARYRVLAKEVAMIQMQPALADLWHLPHARRTPLKPQWLRRQVSTWARWFDWLDEKAIDDLAAVTQVHCDAFLARQANGRPQTKSGCPPGPAGLSNLIDRVRDFADCAPQGSASNYGAGFRPWGRAPSSSVTGYVPAQENRTPVIPEQDFAPLIAAALFVVQVVGGDCLTAQSTGQPASPTVVAWRDGTSRPWRSRPVDVNDPELLGIVMTACFVVVAALTGMRSSELMELRVGCVSRENRGNGLIRFRVRGVVVKDRSLGGEPDTWTVIEPVVNAIELAEEVGGGGEFVFGRTPFAARLRSFTNWVNVEAANTLNPITAQPSLRSFRRTLARTLAFRPHGVLAGKVHLKHLHVATSEGYYGRRGSSAARFLAEVEREHGEAQLERTRDAYDAWRSGQPIAGPGAGSLERDFMAVASELESFSGTVLESERRLELLLRQRADTLHVGPLSNCWFTDPQRARCLSSLHDRNVAKPMIGLCEPSRCGNSTLHAEHRAAWQQHLTDVETLRRSARVPKHEKVRLESERQRLQAIVDSIPVDKER